MHRRLALLAGGLVLLACAPMSAQDAILGQMYGSGVHAYFTRDYLEAHQHLSSAIDAGTNDPRCYYFRGLAYLRLHHPEKAEADFEQAAKLETADSNQFYNVSKALERVQGADRMKLESHRTKARMMALEREAERRRLRYEALRQEEGRVLRQAGEGAGALPVAPGEAPAGVKPPEEVTAPAPGPAPPPAPAPAAPNNPFEMGPAEEPAAKPAAPAAPPAAAEPAAAPAAEAAAQDVPAAKKPPVPDDDLFGVGGAEKPAPQEPAADMAADLFADEAAAEEKPKVVKKPTVKKPVSKKPAADDAGDLFGPDADEEMKPATKPGKKPAADAENPFADEPGAEEPGADEMPAPAAKPGNEPADDEGADEAEGMEAKPAADDAADNPFAEEEPAKPAAKKPASTKAADDENPFGT